jgi:hypothetical protein
MSLESRTPIRAEVIRSAIEAALSEIHVSMPGRVESYDAQTQLADVKPLLQESAAGPVVSLPVITGVPVIQPRSGGFRLSLPVAVGDTVHLVFCERSLDNWLANGGDVDPNDVRKFHLSDAVAYVGLHDNKNAFSSSPANTLAIGKDDGSVDIQITASDISIVTTASSGKINITAGVGGVVNVDVGAGGAINLGGSSAVLAVALAGDTAGPYPIICKGLVIKGKLGP